MPLQIELLFNAAESFSFLGHWDEAIACYEQICQYDALNPEGWHGIGYCASAKKDYKEAIKAYQKAIELLPDDGIMWFGLGDAYNRLGDFERGAEALKRAKSLDPEQEGIDYHLAKTYQHLAPKLESDHDCYADAIAHFKAVIAESPKETMAYYGLGTIYLEKQQLQQALAMAEKALEIDPNFHNFGWILKGRVRIEESRYEEAILDFQKAYKINSGFYLPLLYLLLIDVLNNRPFSKHVQKDYTRQFQPQDHCRQHLQMLKSLADIAQGKDRSIFLERWDEAQQTYPQHWSFSPLKAWVDSLEVSKEITQNLKDAIALFEKYPPNPSVF